ncbi:MAG TPA: pyruvate formate lyase family protein [bacterium]|nr:pyruvate formate lyase family protein [bacterium]
MGRMTGMNILTHGLLQLLAANFNLRPDLRRFLRSKDGWMNFSVGVRTVDGDVEQSVRFKNGRVVVIPSVSAKTDTVMNFKNGDAILKLLRLSPHEILDLLLMNELSITGSLSAMNKFNFFLSLLLPEKKSASSKNNNNRESNGRGPGGTDAKSVNRKGRMSGTKSDSVEFLDNPYLPEYSLSDFPRLEKFLDIHLTHKPEICPERALLMTEWFRRNGFETDSSGNKWIPELRQAKALNHLLSNRKPMIRKNDLIAGATTSKEIGVVVYPDASGTLIWGELNSVANRKLNPYDISEETRNLFHSDIFPYWEKRNFREWVREKYGAPTCQLIDERFAVYFLWKTVALSHTIPDFPKLLHAGTAGMISELREELASAPPDSEKAVFIESVILSLEGLNRYAENLRKQAAREAGTETDAKRKAELERLAEILAVVPRNPARTLDEAVNSIWMAWTALHAENTNAGLSLGRLDQWLQPFFAAEISKIEEPAARAEYVKKAIELIGCFYMRCTDHLPLIPDIGNFLFGGSSSDQAITLGGVTPDGKSAVNDMTYIFLKVTEMLGIRDPNVNARYNPDVNSDAYLKRLCEVNLITSATPSMHNDKAVEASLQEFGYPAEHLHDWSATGCVEPTISGRHIGHTNCMMMNMVAALEMALNNGRHPLMAWNLGPKTGIIEEGAFPTFDSFFDAFAAQFGFLIDQSCEYNNKLGEAHSVIRPTPLLSSFIDGTRQSGKDVTKGGALYNSSGAACIGLADVTDSLMAIKKLVYEDKKTTFADLKRAVDSNFKENRELQQYIRTRLPKFGSGDEEALEMAMRVAKFAHDRYGSHVNFRGGKYTSGFWSMSNHVAFGCLSGALPSGREAGKPFTPGLTPQPFASDNLLDNINDVARLKPEFMNNNIAFNVKVVPSASDSHAQAVDHIFSYVKTYFTLGGMQIQLNVVTSDTLRDAMAHPENYKNLLVRISGYNAYFVTLNRDMQLELIERAEYGI